MSKRKQSRVDPREVAKALTATPPEVAEAEISVLGAMVLAGTDKNFGIVAEIDQIVGGAGAFADPRHKLLYSAIMDTWRESGGCDLVLLSEKLKSCDLSKSVSIEYATRVVEDVPIAENGPYYAKVVREAHRRRKLMDAAGAALVAAAGNEPVDDVIAPASKRLYELSQVGQHRRAGEPIGDDLAKVLGTIRQREPGRITGISYGIIPELDTVTDGMHPGEMIVVGARTSIGKSAFATQVACHVAGGVGTVVVFSLEMSREQLIIRLIGGEADVDTTEFKQNRLVDRERQQVRDAAKRLKSLPLIIDDRRGMTPDQINMAARQYAMRYTDLALVVVDYMQLVKGESGSSIYDRVTPAAEMCQRLAWEINVPVIAVSQVGRDSVKGDVPRMPKQSEYKGSGSIEECADTAILIHRDDYYRDNSIEHDGLAQIRIAKCRNAQTGMCYARWLGYCQRFAPQDGYIVPPPTPSEPELDFIT